jgi:hypothetical protein
MQFQFRADGTMVVEYPGNRFVVVYSAEDGRLSIQPAGPQGALLSAMFRDVDNEVDGDKLYLTNAEGETQTLVKR